MENYIIIKPYSTFKLIGGKLTGIRFNVGDKIKGVASMDGLHVGVAKPSELKGNETEYLVIPIEYIKSDAPFYTTAIFLVPFTILIFALLILAIKK